MSRWKRWVIGAPWLRPIVLRPYRDHLPQLSSVEDVAALAANIARVLILPETELHAPRPLGTGGDETLGGLGEGFGARR